MVHSQSVFYPFSLIAHETGHGSVVRSQLAYDLYLIFDCYHYTMFAHILLCPC